MIQFNTVLRKYDKDIILRLPEHASAELPTRGQVMVKGTIDGYDFTQVIEPDGRGGHWLRITKDLYEAIDATTGDTVLLNITSIKEWPEPNVPGDFAEALNNAQPSVKELWNKITPMARWEWIRWINATKVTETRERRIEASISKMLSGKRRPCCFNLAACTDPALAKNGKLIEDIDE